MTPQDLAGTWRLCSPNYYYVRTGGLLLDVVAQDGGLVGYVTSSDGGSTLFVGGPIDMSTRIWSPDFYMAPGATPYHDDVHLMFAADGNHFTGQVNLPDDADGTWYGAREDGEFKCTNQ